MLSVNQLKKYEYISFDVFGTLIKRKCVFSWMIFFIMQRSLKEHNIAIRLFALKRLAAGIIAGLKAQGEITIEDIYIMFDGISDEERKQLIQYEIDTERANIVPNTKALKLYNECISLGKKVFIISDMYISFEEMSEILEMNGIYMYKKLYLSSWYKVTKRSGKLYEKYMCEQKIAGNEAIHVGNSFISDYVIPKKRGLSAYLV